MSISLDQSADAEFVRFIARVCGVNLGSAGSGRLRVRLSKTIEIYEPSTISKYLARFADREDELLGQTPFERAQVAMWIAFARGIQRCSPSNASTFWQILEAFLIKKTYLAADRLTLADASVFYALHAAVSSYSPTQRDQFANLVRWFDQVQHTAGVQGFRNFDVIDLPPNRIAFTS
ncbi:Glutathione S-transferase [Plasmopara halstedii]|uniref:Glutathione S-transferase n=1 Tax=Plasmopara halstedii TaxID=4781 RepID=A0A0P1AR89_PLAHL|nr:Glutathione S-transferase [Plasmopara halstedii]CEG43877.1 Glutathione S-transferase [Plasmopara halstedii]|eukprot:XP_024580246.1 Glutathione S-transferase [Plasmopara halstedii]